VKPEIIDLIENARTRRGEKFKTQMSVFIVCLILSVFLWSLVKLSQSYFYTIGYRLTYTQVPGNLRLVKFSDSSIFVRIKVQGFDLISEQFIQSQDRVIDVSLRNVRLRNLEGNPWGYLLTNRLGKEIAAQANFPSDLFIVTPDTLYFEFERQVIHRIPPKIGSGMISTQIRSRDSVMNDSLKKIDPNRNYIKRH
jgi:hypothetical protein